MRLSQEQIDKYAKIVRDNLPTGISEVAQLDERAMRIVLRKTDNAHVCTTRTIKLIKASLTER